MFVKNILNCPFISTGGTYQQIYCSAGFPSFTNRAILANIGHFLVSNKQLDVTGYIPNRIGNDSEIVSGIKFRIH